MAISLENPLAVGGSSVLANRFGDLHEPELATAAGICLAGVGNTNTMEEAGEGEEAGPPGNFLVGETDLDGFLGRGQFNKFGHCLVSFSVGNLVCLTTISGEEPKKRLAVLGKAQVAK